MAWELANEPRCKGSNSQNNGACTTSTITQWASEISAFIKSIDSNHLVAIGDEGFFNEPGNPSYPYQGTEGVDFTANLAIDTLDFGTFHVSRAVFEAKICLKLPTCSLTRYVFLTKGPSDLSEVLTLRPDSVGAGQSSHLGCAVD